MLEASTLPTADLLATVTSHVALQIARVLRQHHLRSLLVTGGGAFNTYLIELLQQYAPQTAVTIPNPQIVNFKEALIFALLGYLRLHRRVNTLKSVTGARLDSIGGTVSGLLVPKFAFEKQHVAKIMQIYFAISAKSSTFAPVLNGTRPCGATL